MAYCGLEREILIFLAGGLPADCVLRKVFECGTLRCLAEKQISNPSHVGYSLWRKSFLKTSCIFLMNYPMQCKLSEKNRMLLRLGKKGKLPIKFKTSASKMPGKKAQPY